MNTVAYHINKQTESDINTISILTIAYSKTSQHILL